MSCRFSDFYTKPAVGRIVHYVSYGTPGGEYPSVCRAAMITEVVVDAEGRGASVVHLTVFNPEGVFLNKNVVEDGLEQRGGTWHWPERV
jgi:hypothetical protein